MNNLKPKVNEFFDTIVTLSRISERKAILYIYDIIDFFMKNAYGNAVNIDFVMFRKDIVDYVLNNYQIETYVGNQNNYVEIKFQALSS